MFRNAARAIKGAKVSSADLWADHAEALAAASAARAEVEAAQSVHGDALIEALAKDSPAEREQARLRLDAQRARAVDLENAAAAIKDHAEQAEAQERDAADAAAWALVDAAAQRHATALARADALLADLAAAYVTARECETAMQSNIPKADRPDSWVHTGWGYELGRSFMLRAKLLHQELDVRSGGLLCYVPRDFPSLTELGTAARNRFLAARKQR